MKIAFGYKRLVTIGDHPFFMEKAFEYNGTVQDINTYAQAVNEFYGNLHTLHGERESILLVFNIDGYVVSNTTGSNRSITKDMLEEKLQSFLWDELSWEVGRNLPTIIKTPQYNRELQFVIFPVWKKVFCPEKLKKMPEEWLKQYYNFFYT